MSDEAAASDAAPAPDATPRSDAPAPAGGSAKKRRRGSRGGRNRPRSRPDGDESEGPDGGAAPALAGLADERNPALPDPPAEGRVQSSEAAEQALVRRPRIGDTRPAPVSRAALVPESLTGDDGKRRRRPRGGRGRTTKPAGRPDVDVTLDE